MVVASSCLAFRALITQARILKKFSSSKLDKFTLFTHSFVGWNMENRYKEGESIFLRLSWHFKREKSVFCKASFCKTRIDYACKTSWTRFCDIHTNYYAWPRFPLDRVRVNNNKSSLDNNQLCAITFWKFRHYNRYQGIFLAVKARLCNQPRTKEKSWSFLRGFF